MANDVPASDSLGKAAHIAHSVIMVGSLPAGVHRENYLVFRMAAFDSFLLHARILARFLRVDPGQSGSVTSITDLGGTAPQADDRTARLQSLCRLADRHMEGAREWGSEDHDHVASSLATGNRAQWVREAARDLLQLVDESVATMAADQAQAEPLRFALTQAWGALHQA